MDTKTKIIAGIAVVLLIDNVRIGLKHEQLKKQNAELFRGLHYMKELAQSLVQRVPADQYADVGVDIEFFHILATQE